MKRTLIAALGLVFGSTAYAQSSVTLFGVADAKLAWGRGSIGERFGVDNTGYNASRIGIRGTERLSGGLSVSFWLEAAIAMDTGAGSATNTNNQSTGSGASGFNFNRRSTLSLAGPWGEVRLGRDFTPQYRNLTETDPFLTAGVGATSTFTNIITGVTSIRASNSIAYLLPAQRSGGFYGEAMYYLGENPRGTATADDGTGLGIRVGYACGPFKAALAVSRTRYADGDVRQSNLGGQWNFGSVTLMAHHTRDERGSLAARGWLLGARATIGQGFVRMAYSQYGTDAATDPKAQKLAIGYVHNLSKRTALYTTLAHVRNSGTSATALNGGRTAPGRNSSGIDLGIKHSF